MDTYEQEFGKRVKAARRKAGLRQSDLACEMFVSTNTILNWEKGTRQPNLYTVCELAKKLNVKVGWLVAGEE